VSDELRVGGVTPFTTIDYPGQLAAVVFVLGCPWKCGYCHNPHLQSRDPPAGARPLRWREVASWLRRRAGLIDAVVFSGGEPTIDAALGEAMTQARESGLRIGLHTAGIYPRRLEAVLPLVDWVGVDIKAPLDMAGRYDRITGVRDSAGPVRQVVRTVLDSGVAHEFRTTAHPDFLTEADLLRIAEGLAREGATSFALQIARPVASPMRLLPAARGYPSADVMARLGQLFANFIHRPA